MLPVSCCSVPKGKTYHSNSQIPNPVFKNRHSELSKLSESHLSQCDSERLIIHFIWRSFIKLASDPKGYVQAVWGLTMRRRCLQCPTSRHPRMQLPLAPGDAHQLPQEAQARRKAYEVKHLLRAGSKKTRKHKDFGRLARRPKS